MRLPTLTLLPAWRSPSAGHGPRFALAMGMSFAAAGSATAAPEAIVNPAWLVDGSANVIGVTEVDPATLTDPKLAATHNGVACGLELTSAPSDSPAGVKLWIKLDDACRSAIFEGDKLLTVGTSKPVDINVRLPHQRPLSKVAPKYDTKTGKVVLTGEDGKEVPVASPAMWVGCKSYLDAKCVAFGSAKAEDPGNWTTVYAFTPADGNVPAHLDAYPVGTVTKPEPPEPEPLPEATITAGCDDYVRDARTWMAAHRWSSRLEDQSGLVFACVEDGGKVIHAAVAKGPQGHVLRPNTPVRLVIKRPSSVKVSASVSGTRGVYEPKDRVLLPSQKADTGGGEGPLVAKDWTVEARDFAPRLPGESDVIIEPNGDESARVVVPLTVETTYTGAIRVGVGGIFGSAVDRSYTAQTMPGSQTPEIGVDAGGPFDTELVLGYSVYTRKGGRGTLSANYPWCFSPYAGIGLVEFAIDTSRFEALKSVYLGAEWEPTPQFSVSVGLVSRRVNLLQGDLSVGSALDAGATDALIPTRMEFAFGPFVVLNFSPEFMRVASQSNRQILGY